MTEIRDTDWEDSYVEARQENQERDDFRRMFPTADDYEIFLGAVLSPKDRTEYETKWE